MLHSSVSTNYKIIVNLDIFAKVYVKSAFNTCPTGFEPRLLWDHLGHKTKNPTL